MYSLTTRILPKITYSMQTTSFTEVQCKALNTALDPTMLNKLKLNRHTPKAVLYSPLSKGGLAYPNFGVIQAQKGILTMIKHLRWNKTRTC